MTQLAQQDDSNAAGTMSNPVAGQLNGVPPDLAVHMYSSQED